MLSGVFISNKKNVSEYHCYSIAIFNLLYFFALSIVRKEQPLHCIETTFFVHTKSQLLNLSMIMDFFHNYPKVSFIGLKFPHKNAVLHVHTTYLKNWSNVVVFFVCVCRMCSVRHYKKELAALFMERMQQLI